MNDERAGQLNEPNLMDECGQESSINAAKWAFDMYDKYLNVRAFDAPRKIAIESTIKVLLRRGLINELGIEILKRDGVIK